MKARYVMITVNIRDAICKIPLYIEVIAKFKCVPVIDYGIVSLMLLPQHVCTIAIGPRISRVQLNSPAITGYCFIQSSQLTQRVSQIVECLCRILLQQECLAEA